MIRLQGLYQNNAQDNAAEFGRYIIAGLINTLAGLLVYSFCVKFIALPFWAANFCAMIAGIICGFILARHYVFTHNATGAKKTLPKYILTIGVQFIVSTTLIALFLRLGLQEIPSYILSLPIVVFLSFIMQKIWVFRSLAENK